jgi:hypothetical protein
MEMNISQMMNDYDYDYSNLFRDSLDNLYKNVQNFSGEFFIELISLINDAYDNYTIILNNIIDGKYIITNKIRNTTKKEYIQYINNMLEVLEKFEKVTLCFFEDIERELDKINDFQIDFLYDIFDKINEGKVIFEKFNKNLFKSIEKGIIEFKYDIKEYMETIIEDLLYLTD